jgi:hypothetical protein
MGRSCLAAENELCTGLDRRDRQKKILKQKLSGGGEEAGSGGSR